MKRLMGYILLSWFLAVTEADDFSGDHSLTIFVTFAPGHAYIPEYMSHGMLNDLKVFHYDSSSRMFSSPMKHHTSLSSVWTDLHACTAFKTEYFRRFLNDANSTSGLNGPILQLMYGCRVTDEGKQANIYRFSVDGRYTFTLDEEGMRWKTWDTYTANLKKILDSFQTWNLNNLKYLKQDCVPRLKKFYEYGKEIIHRKGVGALGAGREASLGQRDLHWPPAQPRPHLPEPPSAGLISRRAGSVAVCGLVALLFLMVLLCLLGRCKQVEAAHGEQR
ncbi:major histocompatibility complex class I-related gene protein-like isoform X3 [Paramormyrops kingsleyae]|uniref:major histocompatibility complex class I-related gene protein-like isoform X3 n=1 Tax=Paramormyrops kingsleyae TaxID=1676925 RepID=UPI000CD66BF6|nr:major histocompatibility complex class I-related gene protein-like isoform X3 [Paramormyrops kingsleyae]